MKKLLTRLISCTLIVFGLIAAQTETMAQNAPQPTPQENKTTLRGHIINDQGADISSATITLRLKTDTMRIYGAVSDKNGAFRVDAPSGGYRLHISFVGYESFEQLVTLNSPTDIGTTTLKMANVDIGEVVVKSKMITREADRFVVNVGDSPLAIGRSAADMLALSPGVFIQNSNGTISINGKGGTQVILNERLLRERGGDLLALLNNLKAEDIQRIEVIPNSGADMDADMIGGAIKITLKKQRLDGMNGSVGVRYSDAISEDVNLFNPSLSLNYKRGKFSSYSAIDFSRAASVNEKTEETKFRDNSQSISSASQTDNIGKSTNARLGAIYDISAKQSLGLEGSYLINSGKNKTTNTLTQFATAGETNVNSRFLTDVNNNRLSLSGNYISKLDERGSLLKVMLDYNRNKVDNPQNYRSEFSGVSDFDTTYRSFTNTTNQIYSGAADVEFVLNKTSKINTGVKYTRNTMDNTILFESWHPDSWSIIPPMSSDNAFTEDIAALFGRYTTRLKNNISLNLGLRGEYTQAVPWTSSIVIADKQNYFGLFPTLSLSLPLDAKQGHILIFDYNRKISRPSFAQLNPFRFPISEFSFFQGNPRLKPAYLTNYSASYVVAQRYNFTFGHREVRDGFGKVTSIDPNNPNVTIFGFDNVAKESSTYTSINIPAQLTAWWRFNTNLTATHTELHLLDQVIRQNTFMGNMSNNFTLSKIFTFSIDGYLQSPSIEGNIKVYWRQIINSNLSAKIAKGKITASVFVNDILNSSKAKAVIDQPDLYKHLTERWDFRQVGLSLRYNFKSGKDFKTKNVESGAEAEKARLN